MITTLGEPSLADRPSVDPHRQRREDERDADSPRDREDDVAADEVGEEASPDHGDSRNRSACRRRITIIR